VIGGNDFDKQIALHRVMNYFGYQQRFKRRPELEVANSYFFNASSWHQIDLLYDRKVEETKRQFANSDDALIELPFVDGGLDIEMSRADFQAVSNTMCGDIIRTANQAIAEAGLTKADIDTVYLTGGSMGINHLHNMVLAEYPDSQVIDGDRSTAVARGLALDAQRKFG